MPGYKAIFYCRRSTLYKGASQIQRTIKTNRCAIYRDGARHPRHLNARVGVLLLLK